MATYGKINGVDWKLKLDNNMDLVNSAELIELASSAETITGTDAAKGVTPAGLQAKVSSATAKGIIELATDAEAQAVTDAERAVTAHGLGAVLARLELISFSGRNLAGVCTATGLKVNDVLFSVTGVVAADVGDQSALFEAIVTVADQIQQVSATDLSTKVYNAFVLRMS